jgi:hypothetical protein
MMVQSILDTKPWRVIGASVRGLRHEKSGKPCQDAHHWQVTTDNILVATVADGAGSANLAEVGAVEAARAAIEHLSQRDSKMSWPADETGWRSLLMEALKTAREALVGEAAAKQVLLRELATTLLLVVATPDVVAAAQVGDGAVVLAEGSDNLIALTRPTVSEYLNETTFLTSNDALEMAQIAVHPGGLKQLAMLSDGLQMLALKMPTGTPHVPFFLPLLRLVEKAVDASAAQDQLTAFLTSAKVRERADDDLTLLLANNLAAR